MVANMANGIVQVLINTWHRAKEGIAIFLIFICLGVMATVGVLVIRFMTGVVADICDVAEENRDMIRDIGEEAYRQNPEAAWVHEYISRRVAEAEERAPIRCQPVEKLNGDLPD